MTLPLTPYAETFLLADRTLKFSHWNFSSASKIRLPRIYSLSSRIQLRNPQGPIKQLLHVIKNERHNFLVILKGGELRALEPGNWDKEDALVPIPPRHPYENVDWIGSCNVPGHFYIIRDGTIEEISWTEWAIDPVRLPVDLSASGPELSGYHLMSDHTAVFMLAGGSVKIKKSDGSVVENFFFSAEEDELVAPAQLDLRADGSVIFINDAKTKLYYGKLIPEDKRVESQLIFGPVTHPSLSFCVDQKGILFITENDSKHLHVFLPPGHWHCPFCGGHGAEQLNSEFCPHCNARINIFISETYYKWFDIDLNSLGTLIGYLTVDHDLNLYIAVDDCFIYKLPLEQRDFWGGGE